MTAPHFRGLVGVLLCLACSGLWLPTAQSRVIAAEKAAADKLLQPNQVTASHRAAKLSKLPPAAEPEEPAADNRPSAAASPDTDAPAMDSPDLQPEASQRRHHKMLDFFGMSGGAYYPSAANFYPPPAYQPNPYFAAPSYYDPPSYPSGGYDSGMPDLDLDDLAGRANRRKPQADRQSGAAGSSQNSPIFYIRLPPTPYMYVPGMGYISQPPTIRPMSQQFPAMLGPSSVGPPPPPPPHVNPFIQVPVSFLANGKPTNVYEWQGQQQQPQQPQYGGYPGGYPGVPQYPSYLPARPLQPQRPPGYRPHKPAGAAAYLPDSKITHLKGPYVFNGRPEEIFVLPQSGPSPLQQHQQQQHQQQQQYHHQQQYQPQPQYDPTNGGHYQSHYPGVGGGGYHAAQSPYGDGYNSIYSNQMFSYY